MNLSNSSTVAGMSNTFAEKAANHILYDIYARRAALEGYEYIKDIYQELSEAERHSARMFFDYLAERGEKRASAGIDIAIDSGDTLHALQCCIQRCKAQCDVLPSRRNDAQNEGLADAASLYKIAIDAEQNNLRFFEALYNRLQTNKIYKNESASECKCDKCGSTIKINEV